MMRMIRVNELLKVFERSLAWTNLARFGTKLSMCHNRHFLRSQGGWLWVVSVTFSFMCLCPALPRADAHVLWFQVKDKSHSKRLLLSRVRHLFRCVVSLTWSNVVQKQHCTWICEDKYVRTRYHTNGILTGPLCSLFECDIQISMTPLLQPPITMSISAALWK